MGKETFRRLATTLAKLRQKIQQIKDRNERIGEQGTKAALINPLLAALGWDIEDVFEVRMEYKPKPRDNPVDYALFWGASSPPLFVEAKALDKAVNDDKWIKQTVTYASLAGVEWCVLTNGDEYRFYNALARAHVQEKLFRTVRISDPGQDQQHVLETLDLLSKEQMRGKQITDIWRRHFVDRQVEAAVIDLFRNKDTKLLKLLGKKTSGLRPADIRFSLQRAIIKVEFPLIATPGLTKPLPRGKKGNGKTRRPQVEASLTDLIDAGMLRPPVKLETQYKGGRLQATVEQDGTVVFDGKRYSSLSTAGGMARKSVIGAPPGRPYPQTNGWTFWKYLDPSSAKILELDSLRQKYLRSRTSSQILSIRSGGKSA